MIFQSQWYFFLTHPVCGTNGECCFAWAKGIMAGTLLLKMILLLCNPLFIAPKPYFNFQALKFLHEKGIPYGHLHTGNIMLEGNNCRLLDIENSVLGLPSFYREYIVQFKKINVSVVKIEKYNHSLTKSVLCIICIVWTIVSFTNVFFYCVNTKWFKRN